MIGSRVTIGPGATVHAATIEDCVVIGMGATIMDGVKVRCCGLALLAAAAAMQGCMAGCSRSAPSVRHAASWRA